MARTHHLPDEQVHYTWDVDNAPVLTIDSATPWCCGRATSATTRSAGLGCRRPVVLRLEPRIPADGPDRGARRRAGRQRCASRCGRPHARVGMDGRDPRNGLLPDRRPDAYPRTFDLADGEVTVPARPTSRSRGRPARGDVRALARGRVPALQPRRGLQGLRDRRRGQYIVQRAPAPRRSRGRGCLGRRLPAARADPGGSGRMTGPLTPGARGRRRDGRDGHPAVRPVPPRRRRARLRQL
jgi:hypothetical protein